MQFCMQESVFGNYGIDVSMCMDRRYVAARGRKSRARGEEVLCAAAGCTIAARAFLAVSSCVFARARAREQLLFAFLPGMGG